MKVNFIRLVSFLTATLAIGTTAFGANPLPLDRTPGGRGSWNGLVGVPGGVPNRTVIYQSFSPGATAAQIQSALNTCPSNQVVFLNAGTYNLTEQLNMTRNGVTLRGATNALGQPATIINASRHGVLIGTTAWWNEFQTPVAANRRSWTGGLAQGSTVITVSSTAGLNVGSLIFLDQLNDEDMTAYSPVNPSGPYVTGEYTSLAFPLKGHDRIQFQINRVAAISGNNITLTEPVYMPNWNAARSPQIWFETTPSLTQMSGVENIKFTTTGGSTGVLLQYTYACWVVNCDISIGSTTHLGYVFMNMCVRPEIRGNYLNDTGVADRYGIHTRIVAGALIENNIMNGHSTMLMVNGVSGSVYAYNYATNIQQNTGFMVAGIVTHGGSPNMCLFEGNFANSFSLDSQWQNSAYMVAFRNRFTGKDDRNLATGNIQAVGIHYTNRHASIIGNVLGKTGVHDIYEVSGSMANCYDGRRIFYLGYEYPGAGCGGRYDPVVKATLVRAVNWTAATTTNNGIVLDGFTTNDLPDSYYLSSKPQWFGNLKWPPVDPTNPNDSSIRTNIPAGYRMIFGRAPAGGGNLAPVAAANAAPRNGMAPLTVNFSSAGSSDPEGSPLSYTWIFGDGNTSTIANPSYTYTTPGNFSARLTVSDGANSTTSTNIAISVLIPGTNQTPTAVANASLTSGSAPLTVNFTSAGSSDPEGSTLSYNWSFGTGATSTAANPSYTYASSGIYPVLLTVSDGTNTATASLTISVANPGSGLVAAYGFEETTEPGVVDASGRGNSGTINGATRAPGRFGSALLFNGTGAIVTIPDSSSLDLTTGMTLEAWVFPTAIGGWRNVIFKATDMYFLMASTPQSSLPDMGGTFASANVYGITPLSLNTWTHIAGTYDGSSMRFFVNGVQVANRSQTGLIQTSNGLLHIGGDPIANVYFAGLIDEVRIYNRALSGAEIQSDMNTPVIGASTGPTPPLDLHILGP